MKVPHHQRDALALASLLSKPAGLFAELISSDVSDEGIQIGGHIYSWPDGGDDNLKDRVCALAKGTPKGVRLFEPHKPLCLAKVALIAEERGAKEPSDERDIELPAFFPDFIVLGSPKSATTWLHSVLQVHLGIDVTPDKEPEFFSDPQFSKG